MENRRFFYLKFGFFLSLSLLISSASFSQSTTNFSGSWSFNESKSDVGDGGLRMVFQDLSINQNANSFTLERVFRGQDGTERKMSETYTLDGKESVNPIFNSSKKSKAVWSSDKTTLTVSSVILFEMNGESNEIKTVETYKLLDGGKALSLDSQTTTSMGDRKTLLVYNKN